MLVSAIHRLESVIGIHMSPRSWTSFPHPTLSHPSRTSQSAGFEIPVSCSKFPLAICYTYSNVYTLHMHDFKQYTSVVYPQALISHFYFCSKLPPLYMKLGNSALFSRCFMVTSSETYSKLSTLYFSWIKNCSPVQLPKGRDLGLCSLLLEGHFTSSCFSFLNPLLNFPYLP